MNRGRLILNKSSLYPVEYIFWHIVWGFFAYRFYVGYVFTPFVGVPYITSKRALLMCMVVFSVVGIFFRYNRYMTRKSIAANIVCGIGAYTALANMHVYRSYFKNVMIFFLLFLTLYILLTFTQKISGKFINEIKHREIRWHVIKNLLYQTFNIGSLTLGIFMLFILFPVVNNRVNNVKEAKKYHPNISEENAYYYDESVIENWGLEDNIDSISKITDEELWKTMSVDEKLVVLQDIANCEVKYFGAGIPVTVTSQKLKYPALAHYNENFKEIVIDTDVIEIGLAADCLHEILHECYHYWEHRLVDLYMSVPYEQRKMLVFDKCDKYLDEMIDYKNGTDSSLDEYASQVMEQDAESYASKTMALYYKEISDILNNKNYLNNDN